MPGLDSRLISEIDWELSVSNIVADTRSDFILSPHFDLVFQSNSGRLIEQTTSALRSGRYNPRPPITFSVPKESYLTRPGSILEPADRLLYQALVELSLPQIESQMDRTRTFSHVPSSESGQLFRPAHEGWFNFQSKVAGICQDSKFVLKADVANYFETIPQHQVINLLAGSGVEGEVTNLLEELLLSFRQRQSSGIIQGIFPSDVLGNFYLLDFDGDCALQEFPSARYVDDIFVGFDTELEARRSLIRIIERLRQNGLSLNASKTSIAQSQNVIREEQELDRMFDAARAEIDDKVEYLRESGYGFQGDWINDAEEPSDEDLDLIAVRALLEIEDTSRSQREKTLRFCLPILRGANDDTAIELALEGFHEFPHLTRQFASYLTHFVRSEDELIQRIETLIVEDAFFSDYQRMYALSSILNGDRVGEATVQISLQWLEGNTVGPETRAICAIFAAKFGVARQKRSVRLHYENESSEYVRAAILYAMQFLSTAERKSAKRAWSGQSAINSQISEVI